jgi:hypothetical protein
MLLGRSAPKVVSTSLSVEERQEEVFCAVRNNLPFLQPLNFSAFVMPVS